MGEDHITRAVINAPTAPNLVAMRICTVSPKLFRRAADDQFSIHGGASCKLGEASAFIALLKAVAVAKARTDSVFSGHLRREINHLSQYVRTAGAPDSVSAAA